MDLINAITLKYLYNLKALGVDYIDILESKQSDDSLPDDIDDLRELVDSCFLCELCQTRAKTVFGEGSLSSDIMFIGEAPGAMEDYSGRPFVGRAGTLLTKMIERVLNISRSDVYIANVIKCRPPENRIPTPTEATTCKPYLLKQIEIIEPKVIVALGATAYHHLTESSAKISHVRGKVFDFNGIYLIPTFHPSYLLRNEKAKVLAYQDLLTIKRVLCEF